MKAPSPEGGRPTWRAAGMLAGVLLAGVLLVWLLARDVSLAGRPAAEQVAVPPAAPTPSPRPPSQPVDQVIRDDVVVTPYYWVVDGERIDRSPQLSPDGARLAYLPTVGGQATDLDRLVVRDLATGEERDLTPESGYSYSSVRWSPDGQSLAFVKYRSAPDQSAPTEVWRIDADGSNLRLLQRVESGAPNAGGPALRIVRWASDGSSIETGGTIWGGAGGRRVRADGSGSEALSAPTSRELGVRGEASAGETRLSPLGDYALRVVPTDDLIRKPESAPEGGQSLVLYDFRSKQSRVLASLPGVIYLTDTDVSSDGNWISFRTAVFPADGPPRVPPRLWVVRRDGAELREVKGDSYRLLEGLRWSSVGRAYFVGLPINADEQPEGYLYAVDASRGLVRRVETGRPIRNLASVSRDGRRLLALGGGERAEIRLLEVVLAPSPAETPLAVRPEPAATAGPPVAGPARDLLDRSLSDGSTYHLSPDGRWLAYWRPPDDAGEAEGGTIEAVEVGGSGSVTLFRGVPADTAYRWLPNGQEVVAARPASGDAPGAILLSGLKPVEDGHVLQLEDDLGGPGEVAVSPDGRQIAYTVLHDASPAPVPAVGIEVVNVDGSGRRQVVEPAFFVGHLAWTPDGREIVYHQGKGGTPPQDGDAYVVRADGGGQPRMVLPGARLVAWSPDGRRALWASEPAAANGTVELLVSDWPVVGKPRTVVRGASATGAGWTGDGEWLTFARNGGIYLAPADDAPSTGDSAGPLRLTDEGEWAGAPAWLPGRGVVYRSTDGVDVRLRLIGLAPAATPAGTR